MYRSSVVTLWKQEVFKTDLLIKFKHNIFALNPLSFLSFVNLSPIHCACVHSCIRAFVRACMSFLPIRFPHKNLETTWRKWQRPHIISPSTTLHHTNTQTFPLEHLSGPCCAPLWALTKPACSISVKAQWQLRSSCSSQASRRKKDTRTHTEQWASKEQVLMTMPRQSEQMHSGTY